MTPTDPADPLWGPQTTLAREVLSFSGRTLGLYPSLVRGLGSVKVAAARANASAGVLGPAVASAIEGAAIELAAGRVDQHLVVDPLGGGGGIGVHQNVNEVIASLANRTLAPTAPSIDPSDHVGASQSTADVCHTAARLALLEGADELDQALTTLLGALDAAADRFGSAETLARTCLQDGLAVPARMLLDGSAEALGRRQGQVRVAFGPLGEVVLGTTVIGDGTGAPPAYSRAVVSELAIVVARPLIPHPHPASALQHGDEVVEVSGALVNLATVLAKLAQDLRLLSSGPAGGFGELRLPKVMEGSSFFLAKNNPVVPETVIQASIAVAGFDAVARAATGRAELQLHGYDLTAALAVIDALQMLTRAIHLLRVHVIDGLVLDEDRCRELARLATAQKETPER